MAPGLKWLAVASCGCIAIVLLIQRLEQRYAAEISREFEPAQQLSLARELRRARALHEEVTRRDSARSALRLHETVVEIPHNLAKANTGAVELDVRTALASIQPSKSRIGVFVMDPNIGAYNNSRTYTSYSSEFYAGRVDGQSYCAVIGIGAEQGRELGFSFRSGSRKTEDGSVDGRTDIADVLGPCRWWGVYGAPGAGIEQWFANGASAFSDAPANELLPARAIARRRVFGRRVGGREGLSLQAEACLAGRMDQCVAAVNTPTEPEFTWRGIAAMYVRSGWPAARFGVGEGAMLAQIEREFGAEKFARFWHSDRPLEAAFASAFGVPLDRWIMQWARRHFGVEQQGPVIPAGTLVVSLLTLGVLVLVAIGVATRRQLR